MSTPNYDTRQKIIAQALTELQFARQYKQGKTKNWKINEDLYYSRKVISNESRANVDLGKMSAFVHTILAKIDAPLIFKFVKRKNAQYKRVNQLNALRVQDSNKNDWEIKDIVGKKQALIYGRAIYSYFADSINGYCAHLDNIDVYDFLIDPSAGGIDIEKAGFLGDYGVIKTRQELKDGVKKGIYLRTETNELLQGTGNATTVNQEEVNKYNRTMDQNVWITQKEISNPDKFKFWRWGTTYEGKRYFLLLSERGQAIEVTPLEEKFESNLWWYWTWAAFPDLTEFWTPSFCDYVRDVFMAQAVSINQMLDNAEQQNKPQKVIQVGAIENLAELKYRRDGQIKVKKDFNIDQAIQTIKTPIIDTPIRVYELLDAIQEKASGVTAGAQGAAMNNSGAKATIYKGNEENSADRFGFLNRSYAFGYKRFAVLYEHGVREHLLKKIAVDLLGPDGVEVIEVSRRDIFRKGESFNILVEASNAEIALSETEKRAKLDFLIAQSQLPPMGGKPVQNPQKAYEIQASIAGFDDETIRQLQDTSEFGTAGIMSEADSDIEKILDGETVKPNMNANTAYKQRFVDYMKNNYPDRISFEQFNALASYVMLLDPIIAQNMIHQATQLSLQQQMSNPFPNTPPPQQQGNNVPLSNNVPPQNGQPQ